MYWLVFPAPSALSCPIRSQLVSQAASLSAAGWFGHCSSAFWFHLPDVMIIIWAGQSPFFYNFLFSFSFFFLFFMHAALERLLFRAQWQKAAVGHQVGLGPTEMMRRRRGGVSWQMDGSEWTSGTFAVYLPKSVTTEIFLRKILKWNK